MKCLALLLLMAAPAFAQPALINQTLLYPVIGPSAIASLPTTGIKVGALAVVTDAMTAGSCTVNGGSAIALCRWSGAAWVSLGGAGGGGGTPGGLTTQIQYNSAGAFAGHAGMTYNSGTSTATIQNLTISATLLCTAMAAPGTPAAGFGSIYCDSTSKNLAVKDDAGVVKHGVQTKAPVANNFVTGINDAGVASTGQPTPADLAPGTLATAMTVGAGGSVAPTSATVGVVSANQINGVSMVGLTTGPLGIQGVTGLPFSVGPINMASPVMCQDAGSTDAYACSLSPAIVAYNTGAHYRFKANTANTGVATINFNSVGVVPIKKVAGGITTDLATNDIRAGQWVDLVYDGVNMQMQSTLGNTPAVTADAVSGASNLVTATRLLAVLSAGVVTELVGITATGGVLTATGGFVGPLTGTASTATALVATPGNCTNQVYTGLTATGTRTCSSVVEDMFGLTDVTTANVSTTAHGFAQKILSSAIDPTGACTTGQIHQNTATPSTWECVNSLWRLKLTSTGTGAGSIEFPTSGAMTVGTGAGTVKIGATTGDELAISKGGAAIKTIATTDQIASNPVTAAAVIGANAVVLGDDGARGVKASTLTATVTKTAAGVQSAATSAEIGGLFTGGGAYLKADGTTGGGITTGTTIPATCAEGEYYDHQSARARALFRCAATNHWRFVSGTPKDWIVDEEWKKGTESGTTLQGDDFAFWTKAGTNVGTAAGTVGGTYPNMGTLAIPSGALSGDQATAAYKGLGTAGISITDLAHTFYFETTFKISRATDVKLLVGFQDGTAGFLQYHEFVGLRYEAAGTAGVFRFTCQNASTAYGSTAGVSTITADANFHIFRMYRLNAGTLYMSVDGETPVTVSVAAIPSNNETIYLGLQSDAASAATLTLDRTFLWLGTTR